jgi:hypothetical protein
VRRNARLAECRAARAPFDRVRISLASRCSGSWSPRAGRWCHNPRPGTNTSRHEKGLLEIEAAKSPWLFPIAGRADVDRYGEFILIVRIFLRGARPAGGMDSRVTSGSPMGLTREIRSLFRGFLLIAFILVNLHISPSGSCGPEGDPSRKNMPAGLDRPSVVVFFPIVGYNTGSSPAGPVISRDFSIARIGPSASPGSLGGAGWRVLASVGRH